MSGARTTAASTDSAYETLGVARTAPPEVLKAARNALSKIFHPDNGTAPDAEAMARVNEAYEILVDPRRRAAHDHSHTGASSTRRDEPHARDQAEPASGRPGWGDEGDGVGDHRPPPPTAPPPPTGTLAQRGSRAPQTPHERGWASAHELAQRVRQGHPLPAPPTPLVLGRGEVHHATVGVHLSAYHALDEVTYDHTTFLAGSGLMGLAITGAASALYNGRKRRKAQRHASAQWRNLGEVALTVTSQRVLIAHDGERNSLWMDGGIILFDPHLESYAMALQADGGWPLRLDGPAVPYVAVLLHILLRGTVPTLP